VAIQAAEGLVAIHDAGVIHRDLKTSNIMRDARGFVRLMDFGIAKDSSSDFTAGATGTGQLIGTPEYMSPEQIRGEKLDFRSDVYSLGIVIFEVFTGRVPFLGETPLATILKHLQEPAPLDGPEAARLPRELVPVLTRTLAKDRAARQASVVELIDDLERARMALFPSTAGTQPPALPATRPLSARRPQTSPGSRVTAVPAAVPTVLTPRPEAPAPARPERPTSAQPRPTLPPPAPGVAATPWAVWVAAPVLALAAAGGAFLAVRSQVPAPANAPAAEPAASLAPPATTPTVAATSAAPPASAPPVELVPATPAPRPSATPRVEATRAPGPSPAELAALDRVAAADPAVALAQASTLAARPPGDDELRSRVARYREAAAERLLSGARETLARAEAAPTLEGYLEANRLYSQVLDVDAGNREAREGVARAIRGEERVRSRLTQVSFEQTGTDVSGAPANNLPPGLAAPPPGVEVKRAQPAGPRARIVIEVEPRLLKPGEEYVVRYFLQNESAGPLLIAGASIQNHIGASGVTGGKVEPATTTVAPRARSLLFEARDVWRQELGTRWQTTLRVFLTDGSVFSSSLATRQ
jgi:serine/threonine-protein kinase